MGCMNDKEERWRVYGRRTSAPLSCQCAKQFSVVLLQARDNPGSLTGNMRIWGRRPASISFPIPCRPAVRWLNQYFLKLWQEEGFSLGSHQSSDAFSQYSAQDIGKSIL